jgi:DNA topoisomerase-3
MSIAGKLYTGGVVSYPRIETDSFPDIFDYQSIIHVSTPFDEVLQCAMALENRIHRPRRGHHYDHAHPQIYPHKAPEGSMTNDEKRVYRFGAQYYLTWCSCDVVDFEMLVLFDVEGENFKLKGLEITHRNWLDVYPDILLEWKATPNPIEKG